VGKVLKLMADYGCFPLWEYADTDLIDNANPDAFPLTNELKAALQAWAGTYDKTLNDEYPPDSGFASPAAEDAFDAEGMRLWRALREQLGLGYKIVYYSSRDARLHD
jgi:hypothetical protein